MIKVRILPECRAGPELDRKVDKMPAMRNPTGNDTARVFFALWPSAAERRGLAAWQMPLQQLCGGRAMRAETLHNTLVFIGAVEPARLEALQLAAREAGQKMDGAAFELCFDAARYWQHNHIVYAAPGAAPPQLAQLVAGLEQSLDRHGFSFDRRAYQAHVTLLRNARQSDAALPALQPACWQIRDFVLAESARQDGETGYKVLARFALGWGKIGGPS
jgi:RNA 2',3'-cyclic 3'-phosphodiesterase